MPTKTELTRDERIAWMAVWAAKNKMALALDGSCGFGRPCVGVTTEGHYPDYHWHDEKTYERADSNGDVWVPGDAYHKNPCVAVLGTGEYAENQLYDWLRWFDANGFELEVGDVDLPNDGTRMVKILLGQHRYARMVRKSESPDA